MRLLFTFFRLSVICSGWIHARTVGPVVDFLDDTFLCSAEESVKLFVREFFVSATRLINGACAWLLALSDSNYKQSLRRAWQQKEAWHSWWREERQSTLNAVLAAQCPAPSGAGCLRQSGECCGLQCKRGLKPARKVRRQVQDAAHCSCSKCITQTHSLDAAPPAPTQPASRSSSSWIARVVWKLQVAIIGRARASPAVQAAATGRSSNPLLNSAASMVSMPSLSSVTSITSTAEFSIGTAALGYSSNSTGSTSSGCDVSFSQPDSITSASNNTGFGSMTDSITAASAHSSNAVQLQRRHPLHRSSSSSIVMLRLLLWPVCKFWQLLWTVPLLPLLPIQLAWWTFRYMAKIFAGHSFLGGSDSSSGEDTLSAPSPTAVIITLPSAPVKGARGGKGRLRRSIVFEQPSGSAITHERARPRGLLEELCLGSELCVTAVFEATRWAVRLATLTWPKTHQQRLKQAKQSAGAAGPWQWGRSKAAKTGSSSSRKVGWGGVSSKEPARKDSAHQQQQQHCNKPIHQQQRQSDQIERLSTSELDDGTAGKTVPAAAAAPTLIRRLQRSKSAGSDLADLQRGTARGASALPCLTLRRVKSVTRWDYDISSSSRESSGGRSDVYGDSSDDELSPAAQLILKAGYPLELHTVTTADGYILRMERIPRPGCARVAFFHHGILDTSVTWVSSGATGSQAFAAWDQGFDVWLGSSRSNPPRATRDPAKQGLSYFNFSLNEFGIYDMPAQLDHLHTVKMRELGSSSSSSLMPVTAAAAAADWLTSNNRDGLVRHDMQQLVPLMAAPAAGSVCAPAAAAAAGGQGQAVLHMNRQCSLTRSASDSELSRRASQLLATAEDKSSRSGVATDTAAAADGRGLGRRRGLLQRLLKVGFKPDRQQQQLSRQQSQQQSQQQSPQQQQQQSDKDMCKSSKDLRRDPQQQQQVELLKSVHTPEHPAESTAAIPAAAAAAAAEGRVALFPSAVPCVSSTAPAAAAESLGAAVDPFAADLVQASPFAVAPAADLSSSLDRLAPSQQLQSPAAAAAAAAAEDLGAALDPITGDVVPDQSSSCAVAPAADLSIDSSNSSGSGSDLYKTLEFSSPSQHSQQPAAAVAAVVAEPWVSRHLSARGSVSVSSAAEDHLSDVNDVSDATAAGTAPSAGQGLSLLVSEVHEPQTPDLAESAVCTDYCASVKPCSGIERVDSTSAAAAAAAGCGNSCSCICSSPFIAPAVQQAAVAALMDASAAAVNCSSSSSIDDDIFCQAPAAAAAAGQRLDGGITIPISSPAGAAARKSSPMRSVLRRSYSSEELVGLLNTGHVAEQHAAPQEACQTTDRDVAGLIPGLQDSQDPDQQHLQAYSSSDSTNSSSNSSTNTAQRRHTVGAQSNYASSAAAAAEPYDLRVVAHSLGGLSMLMYCVMRSAAGRAHHIKRLILMSPAGFHNRVPSPWWPIIRVLPYWHKFLQWTLGPDRAHHPAMLPTYIARAVAFSYLMEIVRLPALADFSRAVMRAFFGGDASEWERALLMPHYSAQDMPSCSLHQALHFIQMIYSGKFCMFDYGSASKNIAHYGTPTPPDIGAQYWRLGNLPIDLMAGTHDGIIPPSNVRIHLDKMREQGLQVSYREFAYGHMDFTFSVKEDLRYYVMKCLTRKC